jgi:hypothetical protein
MRTVLALTLLMAGMASASGQGILDRMKEDAERRAENKAARDAENPPPAKPTDSAAPAAPAAPAQAPTAAPATPANPTAQATPTPGPAPAQ